MNIRTAELKDVKQIFNILISTLELQGCGEVDEPIITNLYEFFFFQKN
jgi:hypothetical protein